MVLCPIALIMGVSVGMSVGVSVGVSMGVSVGVSMGVSVGMSVGVSVGAVVDEIIVCTECVLEVVGIVISEVVVGAVPRLLVVVVGSCVGEEGGKLVCISRISVLVAIETTL